MATVVTLEFANFAPLRNETEVTFKLDGKVVFQQTVPDQTDDDLVEMFEEFEAFFTGMLEAP